MIYVNKEDVTEKKFISLLEGTKTEVLKKYTGNIPKAKAINGDIFETVVYEQMLKASAKTDFEGHIEQTGSHSFPDIIAKKLYGVEVKMTISDKWTSTGNSVLETTRIESVETIYMFFGKFGNVFDIRYRKYQDCLYDVGVTHSPRYKIDMSLPDGQSIFNKLGVGYDIFRKERNPINTLKRYYKKQLKDGEELWWISSDSSDDPLVSPIIKSFNTLKENVQEQFICECLILFPEIFGGNKNKFERAAAYLITNYNAVSSHLRDSFSAGGRVVIEIKGKQIKISKLLYHLFLRAKNIEKIIDNIPRKQLSYFWNISLSINDKPFKIWKTLVKHNSTEDVDVIDVFNEGLKHGKD